MSSAPWLALSAQAGWDLRRELARLRAEDGREALIEWGRDLLAEREQITARLRRELCRGRAA